jgi:hypothetical protein
VFTPALLMVRGVFKTDAGARDEATTLILGR